MTILLAQLHPVQIALCIMRAERESRSRIFLWPGPGNAGVDHPTNLSNPPGILPSPSRLLRHRPCNKYSVLGFTSSLSLSLAHHVCRAILPAPNYGLPAARIELQPSQPPSPSRARQNPQSDRSSCALRLTPPCTFRKVHQAHCRTRQAPAHPARLANIVAFDSRQLGQVRRAGRVQQ